MTTPASQPARFLTPLQVELVHDLENEGRGQWMVIAPLKYYSAILGRIIEAEPGMLTDFGSVRRLPLVFLAYGDRGHRPTVIHDRLYRDKAYREEIGVTNRKLADDIFLEAMLSTGMDRETSEQMYFGVRFGGEVYWNAGVGAIGFVSDVQVQLP